MNRREWMRLGIASVCIFLFVLVILVVMTFVKSRETVDYNTDPVEEEIIFHNSSDMTEQEIRLFVEEKRTELKEFFETAKYYTVSEVAQGYTQEDDEKYLVVDREFLEQLQSLLTTDAYGMFWNEFEEVVPKSDTFFQTRLYLARKDLFDFVYVTSAIAKFDVSEEKLILENATNDKITAIINILLCDEENICARDDKYQFHLEKEEETWKIADFTTLIR